MTNAGIAFAAMFAGPGRGGGRGPANAQPLHIPLPAWWLYREPVSARTAVALAAGLAGLVVMAGTGGSGTGAALSLLAAAAITAGTLLSRRIGTLDVVMVSGWHFLLGGAGLAAFAAMVEGAPRITWTPRFVAILAVLALGTAWAFRGVVPRSPALRAQRPE